MRVLPLDRLHLEAPSFGGIAQTVHEENYCSRILSLQYVCTGFVVLGPSCFLLHPSLEKQQNVNNKKTANSEDEVQSGEPTEWAGMSVPHKFSR